MKRVVATIAGCLLCLSIAGDAYAVPTSVSFTGRLSDAAGPVNANVNLRFSLWTLEQLGAEQWTEDYFGIPVNDGLFFVELGSVSALDSTVFNGTKLYLEIRVDGTLLGPRVPVASVPYSVRSGSSATSDTLGTLSPGDVALSGHDHDMDYLPLGTVTTCSAPDVVLGVNATTGDVICGPPKGGTLYKRWGNSSCPATASLVYSGWMGGASHTHAGSGNNYMCMHQSPEWLDFSDANQDHSLLYGVEYETSGSGLGAGASAHDGDAVCAVCLDTNASVQLMIPGTTTCPPTWTEQYEGYLMAERHTHNSKQFVCVDAAFEVRTGGGANQNGGLLYFTEGECGSLPCGPYVQNRELTCVVCTR